MKRSLLALCMLLVAHIGNAQPFTLDQSFGNNGNVTTDFGFSLNVRGSWTRDMALSPDGSMYLPVQVGSNIFIVRHLENGAFDTTYGNKGYSMPVNIYNGNVVLQPDHKVIVGGYAYVEGSINVVLARFTTSGMLDNTFGGGDGMVVTNGGTAQGFPTSDVLHDITLQQDGKIVIAGNSNEDFLIIRYLADGSLDSSFSGDGMVTINFGSPYDVAYAIAVKSDGKIVAAGERSDGNVSRLTVACLTPDGLPDTGFSYDGKEVLYWGASSTARDLAIQTDGKIVLTGSVLVTSGNYNSEFLVVRMNADATLDNGFSNDGIQTVQLGPMAETAEAVALQADGKIVVTGAVNRPTTTDIALARFNTDGTPDNTFGVEGIATVVRGIGINYAYALTLDATGRILTTGYFNQPGIQYAVMRHTPTGSLDNSFDGDGIMTGYKPDSPASFYTAAVQPDGKIVAVGGAYAKAWWAEYHEEEIAVVRFNVNGTIDSSFDEDGRLVVDFGTGAGIAKAITIQADGKILIGGTVHNGRNQDFAVVRLNMDGTLDETFGAGGKLLIDFSDSDDQLAGIAVMPDGRIVAAGRTYDWRNEQAVNFAICRYNADGTPDNSFSGDGKVTADFSTPQLPATHDEINAMVLQPDGKIVVAGLHAWWTHPVDFIVARYNTDGTLDASFNGTGFTITSFGGVDIPHSAALDLNGNIVVSGYGYALDGNTAIARYSPNGTPDSTFDGDGKLKSPLVEPRAMVLQEDGKIIICGMSSFTGEPVIMLMRYNTDGTPDETFSGDGLLEIELPDVSEWIEDIVLDNNRLYLVGREGEKGHGLVAALQMDLSTPSITKGDVDAKKTLFADAKLQSPARTKYALDVYPNPSSSQFTIIPWMPVATTATLLIFDGSGKVVERKQITSGQPVRLGSNYKPGIYFVECIQGNTRIRTKLVKS